MEPHGEDLMEQALQSVVADCSMTESRIMGRPVDLSTFWLLHNLTYASQPTSEVDYSENFRYRVGLERLNVDVTAFDTLQIRYEHVLDPQARSSPATSSRPVSRKQKTINEYPESQSGLLTFGPGESFWQAAGGMEIAAHDYVVFPEAITGEWTGMTRPDGTAFRLGDVQNVLADIGLIPGGATLPEIELRAYLDQLQPTAIDVDEALGVIEAKKRGSGADGHRELAHHRGGSEQKRAYLDFPAVDRGWLVCPVSTPRLTKAEAIGGVTWTAAGPEYHEPPTVNVQSREQAQWIELATDVVLTTVLRYRDLSDSLATTVTECRENPERLYDILNSHSSNSRNRSGG